MSCRTWKRTFERVILFLLLMFFIVIILMVLFGKVA